MKIRWTSRSLRLRITPEELASLQQRVPVSEELILPGGRWSATIYPTDHATGISLRRKGALGFLISAEDLARLETAEEGVYFSAGSDPPVRYYIEKDFPCAHPRNSDAHEPVSETFAVPPGFKASCTND